VVVEIELAFLIQGGGEHFGQAQLEQVGQLFGELGRAVPRDWTTSRKTSSRCACTETISELVFI
jgi:hypothetical protein